MDNVRIKSDSSMVLESIYNSRQERKYCRKISRDAKILLCIVFLGVIGILFGMYRMGNIIVSPMRLSSPPVDFKQYTTGLNENPILAASDAQNKDTDNDGLSDYDETNTYFTSPYLEDTDSDGVSDFKEIQNGTNPNCIGSNCDKVLAPVNDAQGNPASANAGASGEITASSLREILKQGGLDAETIQKLSDADILNLYYSSMGIEQAPAAQGTSSQMQGQGAQTQSISPQQLRDYLKKNGMTDEMLKNFTDDDLLKVYKEVESEQK